MDNISTIFGHINEQKKKQFFKSWSDLDEYTVSYFLDNECPITPFNLYVHKINEQISQRVSASPKKLEERFTSILI